MSNHPDEIFSDDRGRRGPRLRVVDAPGVPLPGSEEAERHVIACCLLDEGATLARCVREKITADAFLWPQTGRIFQVLLDMQRAAKPITVNVLAEELATRQEFEQLGGWPYLLGVTDVAKVPTTTHAGYFIEKVRELWVLRRMVRYGLELLEGVGKYTGGLEDFSSRHALRFQRVADFVTRANRPGPAVEAAAARSQLERILGGQVDLTRRLSLGTPYGDEMLRQLDVRNEDWYTILCGPPSGGKSTVAKQFVRTNAAAGRLGAVFLLETGKRRWQWSLAASFAHVNLNTALEKPGELFPEDLQNFLAWDAAIGSWMGERLWVFDDIGSLEDIERTIREIDRDLLEKDMRRRDAAAAAGEPVVGEPVGLHYVVIDYLQLMSTREKIAKREEYVAYISRECKKLFKKLDITGVVLAQINRKARDEERRPRLSDLRESGAIEQDADCVLAVHTPSKDRAGVDQDGERDIREVELLCLKRRNGPANLGIDLLFHVTQGRYEDAVRKGELRPGQPKPAEGYKRPEGEQG